MVGYPANASSVASMNTRSFAVDPSVSAGSMVAQFK